MNREAETRIRFDRYSVFFMIISAAISTLALLGWLIDESILASFGTDYIPMAPVTAFIFLGIFGVWLIQRIFDNRAGVRILGRLVLLGLLMLILILGIRFITGFGPDIQKLLTPNPPAFGQITSGRMSPLTALGFVLSIMSYSLLNGREPGRRKSSTSAIISLIVFVLSGINCLGYLYRAPFFYGGALIPVALTTALSFLFLSLGLLSIAGPTYWPVKMFVGTTIKARLMRTFIPVSILIVVLQGSLSSSNDLWTVNPALGDAVAVLIALTIVIILISINSKNLDAEIERSDLARLQAEKTLKQSEERFRKLFEQAAVGVALIETKTGRYLDINQRYCDFLGYTKEEMLSLSFQDVSDPDYFQENAKNNLLLLEGKLKEFTIEKRYIQKNGNKVWGELTASALWKAGEESSDFVHIAIVQDITARKQADEDLRESEERFKNLFTEAPLGISLVDSLTGRPTEINPMYAKIAGRTLEEMLSTDWMSISHPDDIQKDLENMALMNAGKIPGYQMEKRYLHHDGSPVWIHMTVAAIDQKDNTHPRHLCMIEDITEAKQVEEALQKSESSLRAVLQSAADGILAVGINNEVLYTNERFAEIWQIPQKVIKSKDDAILLQHVLDQLSEPQSFLNGVQELYKSNKDSFDTLNFKDGRTFERMSHPLMQGEVVQGRVWSFRDVTARKYNELLQDVIYRITQSAMTSDGMDALYLSIHSILRELIPAENIFIALYDPVNDLISFPYYVDQYDPKPPTPTQTQGLTGYVIRTGSSLLATREIYDRLVHQGEVEAIGTESIDWLGVPLKFEGRIIGVIAVQSYTEGTRYNQKDMELLEFVSTQVAQAIERKRLGEEIRSLSLTDDLTGLYNRRGFTILAEQEIKLAHRNNRTMMLFFGDVDNLKGINDTLGHAQGDMALKHIAAALKESFREADLLARIGGDEFVVLALDASQDSAELIIDRINFALGERTLPGEMSYPLTISIGYALYDPETPITVGELLSQADSRMYLQKQARKRKK